MSRKHFRLLAAALRCLREHHPDSHTDDAIRAVAVVCAACNKEFSFDRFYAAANYKGIDNDPKRIAPARITG